MHRKTAIKKERWLLIGDWYIHPDFRTSKRFNWRTTGYDWTLTHALAHKCADGKIGRVVGGGVHKSKRKGLYKIYGKCYYCKAPVGDEIHTLINMLEIL